MDLGGGVGVGDAWEYWRRKSWPAWFVRSESAAVCPGGARWDERYSLLVVLLMAPGVATVWEK
jgi:hypothetical protein